MEEIDKKAMEFAEDLRKKGHTCVHYLVSNSDQIRWCNKSVCMNKKTNINENNMTKRNNMTIEYDREERNKTAMEFAENLIKNGHNCVFYLMSYPVQIQWCHKDVCEHAKLNFIPPIVSKNKTK